MSEQHPVLVRLEVAGIVRELALVGDPRDAWLAVQLGQAVSVALLEMGSEL